jgi:hydrogenase nickel incorporation protein HypA/HybF
MHEYGLCEGIVAAVCSRAGGRPVSRVRVEVGVRHAALKEPMAQAFTAAATGTEAADATLEIVPVPASLHCRRCGARAQTSDLLALCPDCGSDEVDIEGGDELTLVELQYAAARAGTD